MGEFFSSSVIFICLFYIVQTHLEGRGQPTPPSGACTGASTYVVWKDTKKVCYLPLNHLVHKDSGSEVLFCANLFQIELQ